ncbi:MAG: hypothetical protein Q9191_007231 [Dirinaria sp. TL-2023a]
MVNFEPLDLTLPDAKPSHRLPNELLPILEHACDFDATVFENIAINLIKNPNINSSLLFRADILYDSLGEENTESHYSSIPDAAEVRELLNQFSVRDGDFPMFEVKRTFIRSMIPRNPQLDKPIAQTCQILISPAWKDGSVQSLVMYIPHVASVEELPWYHPNVHSVAYLHSWYPSEAVDRQSREPHNIHKGKISLHYRLFPQDTLPLSPRLSRTAFQLLLTLYKHGQGSLKGYEKRVHHDQIIPQKRVQDTYTELKRKHARRLCDNWVEKTEPSKHVFEDLSIAAFLIELWKEMYSDIAGEGKHSKAENLPTFPGFVDIGCGNGVLVDVLLHEGYNGWGFDAHKRKTWSTFEPWVQRQLKQLLLIPQPLFELQSATKRANGGILAHLTLPSQINDHRKVDDPPIWHNGLFATGTFIISNHADELTPWTPLLAFLSSSPFLAIPCCSHNLSGARFRAPSVFNSHMADHLAPSYFANSIRKSKSVAITVAHTGSDDECPESGDLKDLSQKNRSKQPSAYSSLCDWICHLTASVGYVVEKEMLRLPSTRNTGIIARTLVDRFVEESWEVRMERVKEIVSKEGADGVAWVERTRGLMAGKGAVH